MKQGFTLVELAVVLVIIGLIIGGILVASSMMDTSRITAQVKQFQEFDVAAANFKIKYGGLPGDSSVINSTVGNQDGLIDTPPLIASNQELWDSTYEAPNFWNQLTDTGNLGAGVNYHAGNYFIPPSNLIIKLGYNIPISKMNKNSGVLAYGITATGQNYYSITGQCGRNYPISNCTPAVSLTSTESLALDTKMDDGNPDTGVFVARIVGSWVNDSRLEANSTRRCTSASGKYNPSASYGCTIRLDMFSQKQDF